MDLGEEIRFRERLAETAAAWWANVLRYGAAPSLVSDAGHTTVESGILDMVAASEHIVEPSKIDRFEAVLRDKLADQMCDDDMAARWYGVSLGVDYGPEWILAEAAKEAGVTGFPFKTVMSIDSHGIGVRCGYGAPWDELCSDKWGEVSRRVSALLHLEFMRIPRALNGAVDDAMLSAWGAKSRRVSDKLRALPPFPVGDVDELARELVAAGDTLSLAQETT